MATGLAIIPGANPMLNGPHQILAPLKLSVGWLRDSAPFPSPRKILLLETKEELKVLPPGYNVVPESGTTRKGTGARNPRSSSAPMSNDGTEVLGTIARSPELGAAPLKTGARRVRTCTGETGISVNLLEVSILAQKTESTTSGTSALKVGTSSVLVPGTEVIQNGTGFQESNASTVEAPLWVSTLILALSQTLEPKDAWDGR